MSKKTSLQEALIEAKEIEKAAFESAKKVLEESLSSKIEEAVKESLKELENEKVNEGVKLEIEKGAELKINVSADGTTTVETGSDASTENLGTPEIGDAENVETMETPDADNTEIGDATTEEPINTDNNTEDTMEDEMFEITGLNDLNEVGAEPTDVNAPVAPAGAPEAAAGPTDVAPVAEPSAEVGAEAPTDLADEMKQINQKLDMILAHESGEAASTETSPEGEVEIVDDEQPAAAAPVAGEPTATAPTEGYIGEAGDGLEEIVYEVEEDVQSMFEEMSDLDEIEIVDEAAEELEEDSLAVRHQGNQRQKVRKDVPLGKHAPHSQAATGLKESKNIKAQYESRVDELKKENESLKGTIKEYKESFVVLRTQINEVQIFNAKLAYANKLFTNGGLTNDEKIKIAEEFDKVETIEEAKKLYNKLISESNISKVGKTAADKIKSAKPAAIISSTANASQTIYESDEMRRMKKLAGIIKENA